VSGNPEKLHSFAFEGNNMPVAYVETVEVKDGVVCDTYVFRGDESKDLAIVHVAPGERTPLQRVVTGLRTLEGFMSGAGVLRVGNELGEIEFNLHPTSPDHDAPIQIEVGHTMQWQAGPDGLTFYEICEPPYHDGRFEELPAPQSHVPQS
jgi:hypothetical protein